MSIHDKWPLDKRLRTPEALNRSTSATSATVKSNIMGGPLEAAEPLSLPRLSPGLVGHLRGMGDGLPLAMETTLDFLAKQVMHLIQD